MSFKSGNFHYRKLTAAVALYCAGLTTATVQAQEAQEAAIEEILVTGSFIMRQSDQPRPISVISSDEIQQMQQKSSISELFKTLPQVTGSVSGINTQEGGGNSPTNTINLRGLGARATLVLLNGKRQTIDGSGEGVDVDNLAPSIMIERIELLTDGASATYGSDAVAGVVNFITRRNFEGTEIRSNIQKIETSKGNDPDVQFGIVSGVKGERLGIVAGLEVNHTETILAEEVFDEERMLITLQSSFANPGSFVPGSTGSIVAGRRPDPLCGSQTLAPGLRAGVLNAAGNGCLNINSLGRTLQPDHTRINGLAVVTHDLGHGITGEYELGFAHTEYDIPFGFVTPLLPPLPVVPANNPGVIAANAADPNFPIQDYRWWGRPLSSADGITGAIHGSEQDTYRLAAEFNGPILETGWQWRLSGTSSRNKSVFTSLDTLNDRLLNALNGYGGPNCGQTPASDPSGQFQGSGNCLWFNPFANHSLASPGDPEFNDPSVTDFFIGDRVNTGVGELRTINAMVAGDLFDLPGGTTSVALGYQFRKQQFSQDWDEVTNGGFSAATGTGFRFNQDPLPDFSGTRDTDAVFGEIVLYPIDNLELQAAVRYEDFGSSDSVDPKFGLIWSPMESLSLRGTYGTSFQLPREIEMFGASTGGASTRSLGGEGINARGVSNGNINLRPITSDNWTVGLTWNITDGLSLSADWWDIEFKDLVAAETADLILLADMADGFITAPQIVLRDGVPNEVCEVTGRWSGSGPLPAGCISGNDIQTFVTSFINQDGQNTNGLDFTLDYRFDALGSEWGARVNATWTNQYNIFSSGQKFDGVGSHNTLNLGVPNAEWRGNIAFDWRRGDTFARTTLRYISKLKEDDVANSPLTEEDNFITVDLVAGAKLFGNIDLTATVLNVFDASDPAKQNTLLPVTTSIYDWRGRVFRLGLGMSFN
ncbi:MAG: TonB-dependent receptor [Pseudomonadales bacterium]|nr:TonB-dependent receptor [Pseudomonadales bacterium]